jgi:DNA-directed RNA polymerase subunit RPC12/RpoP
MSNVYHCEQCGMRFSSIAALTSCNCQRHPNGPSKGRHKLFEGPPATRYACKYCGQTFSSISTMTAVNCQRHPSGTSKGRHSPALRA